MSKKVLIVHDDIGFVERVTAGIKAVDESTEVSTAISAPSALGMIVASSPDVVVVEGELEGVDGYAFTEQLKGDESTKSIPVMIVAAAPNESTALKARGAGASAHLAQSGDPATIAGKIMALAGVAPAPAGAAPAAEGAPVAPGTPPVAAPPAAPEVPLPIIPAAAPRADAPAVVPAEAAEEPSIREPMSEPVVPTAAAAAPSPVPVTVPPVASGMGSGVPQPVTAPASGMGTGVPQPVTAPPSGMGTGVPQPVTAPASGMGSGIPQPVTAPPSGMGMGVPQPISGSSGPSPQAVSGSVSAMDVGGGVDTPHVDDLLRLMLQRGGSDLHITVGSAPGIRQRGELSPIEDLKPLTPKDTAAMLLGLLSEEQRRRFETELELDFAYSIPGVSRFRANVFQQRNSMGAVFRVIPIKIPTMDELALPKVCRFLAERPRGLVLVTGPTGSGKSTTLAAMIDHINENRQLHIITMEDPIEFMHRNKKSFVNQREIGEDTHSFAAALKRVLRQDPDVILVGEMRDLETISAAITAAETGHLVLATLHTTGGPETVDRIIDVFPPHQQQQVRMQLSNTLEGVLSQVLLRSTDGRSRIMAMEIMLGVPAISNLIREGKTHQMESIIQGGAQIGMQTLDQHLRTLLTGGKITFEEAVGKAKNPRELADLVGRKLS